MFCDSQNNEYQKLMMASLLIFLKFKILILKTFEVPNISNCILYRRFDHLIRNLIEILLTFVNIWAQEENLDNRLQSLNTIPEPPKTGLAGDIIHHRKLNSLTFFSFSFVFLFFFITLKSYSRKWLTWQSGTLELPLYQGAFLWVFTFRTALYKSDLTQQHF